MQTITSWLQQRRLITLAATTIDTSCRTYLDVIAIPKSSEFLLAGGVPDVEPDGSPVRVEDQGMHLNAQGRHVLLLELAGQVALHEGGFAGTSVAQQHTLEGGHLLCSILRHGWLLSRKKTQVIYCRTSALGAVLTERNVNVEQT